jgi:anaerobic selenocysteine-containing dehydrogenase
VAPPPGEARSEVAIFLELARRLGTPLFGARAVDHAVRAASAFEGRGLATPSGALRVLLPLLTGFKLTRGRLGAPGGWSLGRDGALDPEVFRAAMARPGGRIDLCPEALRREAERDLVATSAVTDGGRDLVLMTCRRGRAGINGKLRVVGRGATALVLHLSPSEASRRGLSEGSRVLVETRVGREPAVVALDAALRDGVASVEFGSPGLNRLTDDEDLDPLSGIPALATVPCRLIPVANAGGVT